MVLLMVLAVFSTVVSMGLGTEQLREANNKAIRIAAVRGERIRFEIVPMPVK